jgi:hypothetical protein
MVCVLLAVGSIAQAKTDVVVFSNGDRLTGEVKSLERGRLRFNTDATDTISIEWDNVAYLSSDQNIQVETIQGVRHLGQLAESEKRKTVIVQTDTGSVELGNIQIVKMSPIEDKGVDRFDGDITAGYNFAKADETTQVNLGVDINYRTEHRIASLDLDAVLTDSAENEANQRESLTLDTKRLLRNRWLWGANISLDRNDELGIDMRTSIGAGGGRILRQTDHSGLILEGGLKATREDLAGSTADEETLEAYGLVTWDWFRYDTPELDLSTSLEIIPNLSDTGRVRSELDVTLKWEMIEDLFWQLSLYDSYDSRPATAGAEKNDYGIVTSLGYDF